MNDSGDLVVLAKRLLGQDAKCVRGEGVPLVISVLSVSCRVSHVVARTAVREALEQMKSENSQRSGTGDRHQDAGQLNCEHPDDDCVVERRTRTARVFVCTRCGARFVRFRENYLRADCALELPRHQNSRGR